MNQRYTDVFNDTLVCAELKRAWENFNPGLTGGHEEGGFILKDIQGAFGVVRWAVGDRDSIFVPPHPGCKIEAKIYWIEPNGQVSEVGDTVLTLDLYSGD
jgi:hypothetical protein